MFSAQKLHDPIYPSTRPHHDHTSFTFTRTNSPIHVVSYVIRPLGLGHHRKERTLSLPQCSLEMKKRDRDDNHLFIDTLRSRMNKRS